MGGFKDVEAQARLLELRGVTCDDHTTAILMREGYHVIVGKYSDPFLVHGAPSPTYLPGTTFASIYALHNFDRELRSILLRSLMRIETTVSSLVVYTFGEKNRNAESHLDPASYTSADSYLGHPDKLEDDVNRMIETLSRACRPGEADGDELPLWIAFEELTFGGVRRFYALMRREDQELLCKRLSQIDESKPIFTRRGLYYDLETLVDARNICAHNDRLYDTRFSPKGNADLKDLVRICRSFLCEKDERLLLEQIGALVTQYEGASKVVAREVQKVRSALG